MCRCLRESFGHVCFLCAVLVARAKCDVSARVKGVSTLKGYCDGGTAINCSEGFATSTTDCRLDDRVCVAGPSRSMCVLSSEPDPRCSALVSGGSRGLSLCAGYTLLTSVVGFSRGAAYLSAQKTCVQACASPAPEEGDAFCAASSDLDPRCASTAPTSGVAPSYCIGETAFGWRVEGFLAEGTICDTPGSACTPGDGHAKCADSDAGADAGAGSDD
jgi:hypothetical protein